MPRFPHTGKRMEGVECFVLRNGKIDSVGRIDLLADTVTAPVLVPWNSLHLSNVPR